ncbi:hypothetical protein GCM10027040_27700 [Halomonas shantousis]
MRTVQFPVEHIPGSRLVSYPDDKALFANARIVGDYVVADYEGRLALDGYVPIDTSPRHITVGAFFDRFGDQKYPILSSDNTQVKALITDCTVREHIDLDSATLPAGLQMLVDAGFTIDPEAVLSGAVQDSERPGR